MSTTVQTNTTPKTTSPRRSRFPGKESGSVSFNLTALGRQLLKEQAATAGVSNGDYVEMLIRERSGMPPLKLPSSAKQTGPKGGAKSYFFGKNRGTTTAVCVTPMAHRMLDEQVAASRMSRGDYIEYLLREKAGVLNENSTLAEDGIPAETVAEDITSESIAFEGVNTKAIAEAAESENFAPTSQPFAKEVHHTTTETVAEPVAEAQSEPTFDNQQTVNEQEVQEPVVAFVNPATPISNGWGNN